MDTSSHPGRFNAVGYITQMCSKRPKGGMKEMGLDGVDPKRKRKGAAQTVDRAR